MLTNHNNSFQLKEKTMNDEKVFGPTGTTIKGSIRWAKHEKEFIQNIDEVKRKIKEANNDWAYAFQYIRDRFPAEITNDDMIYTFCGISESSYYRRQTNLPSVKSSNVDILNLILAGGWYVEKDKVSFIFTRYVHAPDPNQKTNLDDIIYSYIVNNYDYYNDILPLVVNHRLSPFLGYKRFAELLLNQTELGPFDFVKKLKIRTDDKNKQDLITFTTMRKDGGVKYISVVISRGSMGQHSVLKDAESIYSNFLNYVYDKTQQLNALVVPKIKGIVNRQCESLTEKMGTKITISSMRLPNRTLMDKYSRYTKHPATMPFTRDNLITIGTHLAMTYEQINLMLKAAYMDQLVYKSYADCMLSYVIGGLEIEKKLSIDLNIDDIEKIASHKVLYSVLEDHYDEVKKEVMSYFQGFSNKS